MKVQFLKETGALNLIVEEFKDPKMLKNKKQYMVVVTNKDEEVSVSKRTYDKIVIIK